MCNEVLESKCAVKGAVVVTDATCMRYANDDGQHRSSGYGLVYDALHVFLKGAKGVTDAIKVRHVNAGVEYVWQL